MMNRHRMTRRFALAAAVALCGCALAWAHDAPPRPDSVADDQKRPQILVLDRKDGPPGPIVIPRPIEAKPFPMATGGSNLWGNFSAAFSGPVGGPGGASTTQIEARLESVAQKLR